MLKTSQPNIYTNTTSIAIPISMCWHGDMAVSLIRWYGLLIVGLMVMWWWLIWLLLIWCDGDMVDGEGCMVWWFMWLVVWYGWYGLMVDMADGDDWYGGWVMVDGLIVMWFDGWWLHRDVVDGLMAGDFQIMANNIMPISMPWQYLHHGWHTSAAICMN